MKTNNRKIISRVKCDSKFGCGSLFNVKKIESMQIVFGVTAQYIKCPKCGAKYLTNIFNYDLNALIWHNNHVSSGKEKIEERKEIKREQKHLIVQFRDILNENKIDTTSIEG